jgi:hypothetical protein
MVTNGICADKRVNDLSDDTSRLAFTWLITFADCEGRTHGDPTMVRSMLFPRRTDITTERMAGYIQEWADCGLVVWYEAHGDKWIAFPGFAKNQPGLRKDREPESAIPEPPTACPAQDAPVEAPAMPEDIRQESGNVPGDIRITSVSVPPVSRANGMEEKRREYGVAAAPPPTTPRQPSAKDRDRKALEDHFVAVTGLQPPVCTTETDRRSAGNQWWKPLRILLEDLAKDDVAAAKRLIDQSVKKLRDGECTIADPNSILKTARALSATPRASPRATPPIVGWRSELTGESSHGTS